METFNWLFAIILFGEPSVTLPHDGGDLPLTLPKRGDLKQLLWVYYCFSPGVAQKKDLLEPYFGNHGHEIWWFIH